MAPPRPGEHEPCRHPGPGPTVSGYLIGVVCGVAVLFAGGCLAAFGAFALVGSAGAFLGVTGVGAGLDDGWMFAAGSLAASAILALLFSLPLLDTARDRKPDQFWGIVTAGAAGAFVCWAFITASLIELVRSAPPPLPFGVPTPAAAVPVIAPPTGPR